MLAFDLPFLDVETTRAFPTTPREAPMSIDPYDYMSICVLSMPEQRDIHRYATHLEPEITKYFATNADLRHSSRGHDFRATE